MILSQTKMFNIFPSTIQLCNILKLLTSNCDRDTINYISARDLWINKLYISLSNESKINGETKLFKPVQELKALLRTIAETMMSKEFQSNLNSLINKTVEEDKKMEEDLDFFLSDNANHENILIGKKKKNSVQKLKPYNASRIKSRNFLTNILYKGVKEEDLFDQKFIFDVHILITKNTNPFSLEGKIFDVKDREIIYMFWDECLDSKFYKHTCLPQNLMYLNRKNVLYPRVAEIVWKHIENDGNIICKMRKKLIENRKTFQFVCSNTYPEVCSFVEKRGIDLRNEFRLKFKEWKDKKINKSLKSSWNNNNPHLALFKKSS